MKRIDIVGIILTVLLTAAAALFFIGNGMRRVNALAKEQRRLTDDMVYLTALTNALGEAEVVLQQMRREIEKVEEHLPAAIDVEDFYLALAEMAATAEVRLTNMEPGQLQRGDGYLEFPITLTTRSTFPQLHQFIHELGRSTRLSRLDFLAVTLVDAPDRCNAQMLVKIYARTTR